MYIYKFELNRNGKVDSVDDVEELVNFFGKFKLGFLLMFNKLDVIEVYFQKLFEEVDKIILKEKQRFIFFVVLVIVGMCLLFELD